ncbi:unnamed protein product, partial [Ectocarpus sp. 12 AP-2014]
MTFSPNAEPKIPRNVTVTPGINPGEFHVGIGLPVGTDVTGAEGLPLQGFRVEVAKRVNEMQMVAVVFTASDAAAGSTVAYPTQGSYTLTVGNATTWCLDWDAPAEDIQLALDSLATVDGVEVDAMQPEINSTSNGTSSEYSSRPMLVSFTGSHLSNGDQDLMEFSLCTTLNAGAYLDVYTVSDGVAGVVSPTVAVSTAIVEDTDDDADAMMSGSFSVSFGYRGDLGLRLGEGNETSVYVTVEAGSRTVQCSEDLSHYVSAGDVIEVGGVQLVVTGDFVCEDTVANDNTVGTYPCSLAVESPHPSGAVAVPAYGASNGLGSVHVETGSTRVLTDWDLTPYLTEGDAIIVRDPTTGEYFEGVVASVDQDRVFLQSGYDGPSAVRAAAFFSPYAVVPFDASAEEVRDAIESLPSVGSAEVTREGPDETLAFAWSVTLTSFNGPLSGAHALKVSSTTGKALEVAGCGGAGNGTYAATGDMVDGRMRYKLVDVVVGVEGSFVELAHDVSTRPGVPEVQEIQLGASSGALDGTFMVDFADAGGFTAAWDISAGDMEVLLEQLPTVGDVTVARGAAPTGFSDGYTWTVTFETQVENLEPLFVN